jgi:hypothetical protein
MKKVFMEQREHKAPHAIQFHNLMGSSRDQCSNATLLQRGPAIVVAVIVALPPYSPILRRSCQVYSAVLVDGTVRPYCTVTRTVGRSAKFLFLLDTLYHQITQHPIIKQHPVPNQPQPSAGTAAERTKCKSNSRADRVQDRGLQCRCSSPSFCLVPPPPAILNKIG